MSLVINKQHCDNDSQLPHRESGQPTAQSWRLASGSRIVRPLMMRVDLQWVTRSQQP